MTDQQQTDWRLTVLEGPHRGATLALPCGGYRIGRGADNDIVLADPAVAEAHATLMVDERGAALTSLAPGLSLNDRALAPGTNVRMGRQMELAVGGTRCRLEPPPAARPSPRARVAAACAGIGGVIAAALLLLPATHSARPPAGGMRATAGVDAGTAARQMARDIHDARLAGAIRITLAGGAVLAEGIVPADAMPRWHLARAGFDRRYGATVALLDRVSVASAGDIPPLAIAALALAPVPNLITADGEHYTEGAVVDGGWIITRIARDGITLRRGDRVAHIGL